MEESEQALIQTAKSDPEAFGALYQRFLPRVYSYVYYRVGSAAEAEDLTSRVFLQALAHISSYTDRGLPFGAWLFRIAHNLVANWHRDRGRHPAAPLDEAEPGAYEQPDPENAEERDLVRRALTRLSADRQHLIVLKFVEGMTNAEIGCALGRSEGAVKTLLHRTLRSLREHLADLDRVRKEDRGEPKAERRDRLAGRPGPG